MAHFFLREGERSGVGFRDVSQVEGDSDLVGHPSVVTLVVIVVDDKSLSLHSHRLIFVSFSFNEIFLIDFLVHGDVVEVIKVVRVCEQVVTMSSLNNCFRVCGQAGAIFFIGGLNFTALFIFLFELLPAFVVNHLEMLVVDLEK